MCVCVSVMFSFTSFFYLFYETFFESKRRVFSSRLNNSAAVCGCALFFLSFNRFVSSKVLCVFLSPCASMILVRVFFSENSFFFFFFTERFFLIFSVYFQTVVHLYIFFQSNAFKHLARLVLCVCLRIDCTPHTTHIASNVACLYIRPS